MALKKMSYAAFNRFFLNTFYQMNGHVNFQLALLFESFVADFTTERSLAGMNPHMHSKVCWRGKWLAADGANMLEFLGTIIILLVRLHLALHH